MKIIMRAQLRGLLLVSLSINQQELKITPKLKPTKIMVRDKRIIERIQGDQVRKLYSIVIRSSIPITVILRKIKIVKELRFHDL